MRVTVRVGSANAVAISVLPVRSPSIVLVVPLNGKASMALAILAIVLPRTLFGTQILPVNSARLSGPTSALSEAGHADPILRGEVFA